MNYSKSTIKAEPNKHIVIYNCETKTAIMVFSGYAICSKVLFPRESKQDFTKKIRYNMEKKKRMLCVSLGFEIAIRPAKEEHILLLGNEQYITL